MTVAISIPAQLISLQFGVNEISSAITIAKSVGSFLSVDSGATVFLALEKQYGVFLEQLPEHLRHVQFSRCGTVLGGGQKRIFSPSMLPNMSVASVTGIATFVVLVLRYVETPDAIIDMLQSLLKGELGTIRGGQLEPKERGSGRAKQALPYSIRDNLRTFVSSVLDADADSEQHGKCLQWFSQLSALAGRAHNFLTLSLHSRLDHRRFLQHLLAQSSNPQGHPSTNFHTLSTGTAMIALAAMANGANVSLQCAVGKHERIAVPENSPRREDESTVSVTLWLTAPPEAVAQTLHAVGTPSAGARGEEPEPRMMTIFGGDAEVSRVIAQQLSCGCPPDQCLRLWEEGLSLGERATWEVVSRSAFGSPDVNLRLSENFLNTSISALLAPIAETWCSGPLSDKRHHLARKGAYAYDRVYQYTSYRDLDRDETKKSLDLILVAFTIGCLKRLVSYTSRSLSAYALALDVLSDGLGPAPRGLGYYGPAPRGILEFCNTLVNGPKVHDLMFAVGNIWGGLVPQLGFPDGNLIGIVCPEATILLDVICDPKRIAEHGVAGGIMSLHTGSVPILPRDPIYGAVMAGDPNPGKVLKTVNGYDGPVGPSQVAISSEVIFTVEPFTQANGSLSAVLCGWESGDVAFQLSPEVVFRNLVHRRTLRLTPQMAREELFRNSQVRVGQDPLVHIRHDELVRLQHFKIDRAIGLIDIGPKFDWQVVAAGCVATGFVIMVCDEEECDELRSGDFELSRLPNDVCLILCREQGEPGVSERVTEEMET
jgi:hypothetical protein